MIHVANLSNGVICAPDGAMRSRIQSTTCEAKRWEDLLWTIPIDLYVDMAEGRAIVVHDQSERLRATRAQWQGLSWLRHACRRAWNLEPAQEFSRNGMDVTAHWDAAWLSLSHRCKRMLAYYEPLSAGHIDVSACKCERVPAHLYVTPSIPRLQDAA